MMPWLLVGLGLAILLLAGDALVKGAVNLSLRVGVPALIVSLTIVAFGTSAPELLISVNAVLADKPGLALGNVVGSNIANILLVMGVPAVISVIHTSGCRCSKSYLQMLGATGLFIGLAFIGTFTAWSGLILLAALGIILSAAFNDARRHRAEAALTLLSEADSIEDVEGADPDMPGWQIAMFLALGLIGLPLGSDIMVDNASELAHRHGVSDSAIGLTLVALGTSLPELATTVMAAIRRQADVVVGNVIGSNMFNLLAIIGIATLVGPIPVDPEFLRFDLWVMLAASLLLAPIIAVRCDIGRLMGVASCGLYVIYVYAVLI